MRRPQRPSPVPDDAQPPPAYGHGRLPAELNAFVGRERELARLEALLGEARLVTLAGVAGVGKTRCATRIAALLEKRYCDGVRIAGLSDVRDPELLDHALAEALGITDHTGKPPRTALLEYCAERQLLLVVDGFEHLVDACAELLQELLRRAPGVRVLTAGRRPLRVDGEHVCTLAPMTDEDAVELFALRARAVRPGPSPAGAERETVRELCRRLDGIPLALELAAGRTRVLSAEQVLQRLDDRFRLLTGGSRSALPRHQTLRTAVGWSHELCTSEERLLWARLSVFAGSFDLEAVEYVCGGHGLPAESVLDVLDELLAQSVVVREDAGTGSRYRLLETIREYGAQWLEAAGDTERIRRRHRDWYLGLATWCELDWFSPRQAQAAARAERELPNLRRSMECSMESPQEVRLAQYLAGALWFYWAGCGRLAEGRHWLEQVLEEESGHDASRLKALWVLGYVAVLQGDTVAAVAALLECREAGELSGDASAVAYAVHRTGCLALVTDDLPRAEELLGEALVRYGEIGELNSHVLMARVELAMAVAFGGDLAGAAEICREVREVCDDHGERWTRSYALYVLAYVALEDGRCGQARRMLRESLSAAHTFHDLLGTVLSLELTALVTVVEGDAAEAAVLQGTADRIWPSVGLPLFGSAFYGRPRARCAELARAALGGARYEELRRDGGQLATEAAVARAAGGRAGGRTPGEGEEGASAPGTVPDARRPAASRRKGRGGPEL
ncbi:AAA family ATPase [Streptomyces sp. NBC_01754]|uniref:ATP-binding protein n=1 Tax=Streptomyces sp. NBC_01754 TaxID=2975930 RepID=UPI002DDC8AC7|nr:AAA family ATPase [Streptomyces sp. NBC_01754]WSC91488.1 AAA family ATPase [Streptomyces sp. NBC_01754]